MKINILDFIERIREQEDLSSQKTLLIIQIGNEDASNLYIKSKIKEAEKWNTLCTLIKFDKSIKDEDIIERINNITSENYFDGIIYQLPLVGSHDLNKLMYNTMFPEQDVDGFFKDSPFMACTPKGILTLINNITDIQGKSITIIGRGKTVGQPLISELLKEKCTLTCCNSSTSEKQLKQSLINADIVISAVGKPNLFSEEDLKEGCIVIDAGISRINGKQVGDFSHEGNLERINYTPWTNGVGKLTVMSLMLNIRKIIE